MEFCLVGWEHAWELNVEMINGSCGMRDMKTVCDRRNSMSLVGRLYGGV